MVKGLPSLLPNELRLALFTVGLVVCWGVLSFIVQPLMDRHRDLQLQVTTQQEKFEALAALMQQASVVDKHYQAVAPYLPSDNEDQAQHDLLNELEELSRQANLRLNMKPRQAKKEERINRFEVELDVEGSQQNVLSFLDAILTMPRLITVERLRIATIPTKEQLLRANIVIQRLNLS